MKSKLLLMLIPCMLIAKSSASGNTLFGKITDDSGLALPGVTISIPALKRGAVADDAGAYRIENVPHGVYVLEFSLIGYALDTRRIDLDLPVQNVNVVLHISSLPVKGVTVTGTPQPLSILESPQPISIVGGRQLERERGEAVMRAIENMPGVSLLTTGSGIAKPVVRGLTSQRVLVVSDGIRQEGQQWGDEHGPEIDAMNVERIEVVRGPASVLYGSDAIGGVVNVIAEEVPAAEEGAARLGGKLTGNGFSNNSQGAGSLALEGAQDGIGYRGGFSARKSGDIKTPDGELFNSGAEEVNGTAALGWRSAKGSATIDYAHFGTRLEIHENPAEDERATPFQKALQDRVHIHALVPSSIIRLELDGGWQRNNRREFEEEDAADPVLNLILKTAAVDLKGHHHLFETLNGTAGVSFMRQVNESIAEEKLVPDFELTNFAGYLYEQIPWGSVTLSAGVRGDKRTLDVTESADLGVEAQERDYSAFTANGGIAWNFVPGAALAASVGRAWRAPTPFELFVDGVHEGTIRFEVGDPDLEPEISLNLEAGARYVSPKAEAGISVFRNAIDQFIYLFPTGHTDPESGFGVYENRQADATLVGAEIFGEAQASRWLTIRAGLDLLRGENEETDRPLPLMPANRLKLGATISQSKIRAVAAPYASVDVKIVDNQDRIEEFETTTAGYTLVDIGAGLEIPRSDGRVSIDAGVENLLDEAYRDHLSRYKKYASNPGRNFTLKVTVPLTVVE